MDEDLPRKENIPKEWMCFYSQDQRKHLGPLSVEHMCPRTANPNDISFTSRAQTAQFGFSGTLMTSNGQAYGTCASQDRKEICPCSQEGLWPERDNETDELPLRGKFWTSARKVKTNVSSWSPDVVV